MTLHSSIEQDLLGKTLEESLTWHLIWLMVRGTGHPQGLDWGLGDGMTGERFSPALSPCDPATPSPSLSPITMTLVVDSPY